MPAVGMSIDDSCIRFVQISEADGITAIAKHGVIDLPQQAIVQGEIVNSTAVAAALSSIRAEHNIQFARIAFPDDKIYVFKIQLPFIPEKEIRSALEFKIDENIPMSANEAIFDYAVVDSRESVSIDVVVSAVSRSTSENYNALFKSSGIQPLCFVPESQAVANSIVPQLESGPIFVINFFAHKTTLSIVEMNIVQFSLTMRSDDRLSESKPTEGSSVTQSGQAPARSPKDLLEVKQELERIMHYWQDKSGTRFELQQQNIIISGAIVLDAEFVESFSKLIGIPVRVANPWCNIYPDETQVLPLPKDESFRYAAAIGLALGQSQKPHHNV